MKYLFFLFFFLIGANFVYSVEVEASCCYSSTLGIYESSTRACDGGAYLGPFNFDRVDGNLCGDYDDLRLGCVDESNKCYNDVLGNEIYNIAAVLNSFDFDNYCASYKPLDNTCSGSAAVKLSSVDVDTSSGVSTPGSSTEGDGTYFDETTSNFTRPVDLDNNFCEDAGGPFGFYVSKNSCENYITSGSNSCIFNPYLKCAK